MIAEMDKAPPTWWKPRGAALSDAVRYPATDSVKEWGDEILALDQFLVEGFLVDPLRELARTNGRAIDKNWASLRVVQDVLVSKGRNETDAKALVVPIQTLHGLRTHIRGHAAAEKKTRAVTEARTAYGNLRAHFKQTVSHCAASLSEILKTLETK